MRANYSQNFEEVCICDVFFYIVTVIYFHVLFQVYWERFWIFLVQLLSVIILHDKYCHFCHFFVACADGNMNGLYGYDKWQLLSSYKVMTLYYDVLSTTEDVWQEETCLYELSLKSFLCGLSLTKLVGGASFM